jgi:hypothetical protein
LIYIASALLILLDDAVSRHESEDTLLVLIESGRFGLSEEGPEILGLVGEELISFGVEIDL